MMQPQHNPPIFRCRPERVHGMPVTRLILDFAAVIPRSRFHEKPPKLAISLNPCRYCGGVPDHGSLPPGLMVRL